MPSANPSRMVSSRPPHEGSRLRSPTDSDDAGQLYKRTSRIRDQSNDTNVALQKLQRTVDQLRRRILGGGQAATEARWQEPYKELDPDVPVDKGTWVYISPENPLVTTGMTDPIAGSATKAYPGIWEAAQDVPASTGVDTYNVPQTDYPGATGTPSGSPLKGDLDGESVYWILICPTCGL